MTTGVFCFSLFETECDLKFYFGLVLLNKWALLDVNLLCGSILIAHNYLITVLH